MEKRCTPSPLARIFVEMPNFSHSVRMNDVKRATVSASLSRRFYAGLERAGGQ